MLGLGPAPHSASRGTERLSEPFDKECHRQAYENVDNPNQHGCGKIFFDPCENAVANGDSEIKSSETFAERVLVGLFVAVDRRHVDIFASSWPQCCQEFLRTQNFAILGDDRVYTIRPKRSFRLSSMAKPRDRRIARFLRCSVDVDVSARLDAIGIRVFECDRHRFGQMRHAVNPSNQKQKFEPVSDLRCPRVSSQSPRSGLFAGLRWAGRAPCVTLNIVARRSRKHLRRKRALRPFPRKLLSSLSTGHLCRM